MNLRPPLSALTLLVFLSRSAAGFAGTNPFDFLQMEAGARQSALGGAFVAGRDDANVLAYNPAGLASLTQSHASFMHTAHFSGVSREHLAVAFPNGFGAGIDYLRYGTVPRTTLSNPSGTGTAGFTPSAYIVRSGLGKRVAGSLSAGANVLLLRQQIDGITATAYGLDAGIQGTLLEDPGLLYGISLQNMGPRTRFQSARESLPFNVRIGAALRVPLRRIPLGIAVDLNKTSEDEALISAGLSANFQDRFSLRFGYNTRNDAGPGLAFGFGLRHLSYSLDYALVPFGLLGTSHQVSLGVRWGR